ncbi:MAG TPA: proline dehydrogenase family protein, partial [Tepidisphaeraceae bacterium]
MAWWRSKTTSPASAKSADDEGDRSDLEPATQRIGLEILQSARAHRDGRFSRRFWSDQLMQWSMKDPAFKTQLFRFIDAFPMLRTPEQIRSHLLEYLMQPGVTLPAGMSLGLKAGAIFQGTLASTIGGQIQSMAEKFILAESAAAALPKLRGLWDQSIAFSVDLLGEACVSDAEAAEYQRRYLELIEVLAEQTRDWPANPVLETNHLGAIPRANVSVKISSLSARIKPADTEGSVERLMETLRPILQAAQKHSVFVNFDIEQHSLKELTLALFRRCCEAIDFPAGLALQAYLCGGDEDAAALIEWAKSAGRQITVRLVKGAYWDYEVVQAEMMGWPAPVWTSKVETDACFERMAGQFLAATPRDPGQGGILLALGSHNVRSIAAALAQLHAHGLPPNAIEIQMLHGMADELKGALVEQGLRLREYAPVGEMIPGMAYLVRRLLENTSNESWLRAGFASDADPAELLAAPNTDGVTPPTSHDGAAAAYDRAAAARQHRLSPAADDLGDGLPFLNEPLRDFSDAGQRARFAEAIGAASVPAVANDSTVDQARTAVGRAVENFPTWRDTAAPERRAIIVNAAAIMRRRRDELCGIIIRESGKTWSEADADVCEAIDFCEYYARQAVGLFAPTRLGRFVGEHNLQWHEPRGVAAIISPWNFPLSISTGMTVAALVTGNCAILKPAEQTPAIARVLCEILWQAGIPRDVLQ